MSASTADSPATDRSAYRLPTAVTPRHYRLVLAPDLDAATFSGDVEIDVTIHEQVSSIILNAAELTITLAELNEQDADAGYALVAESTTIDDEDQLTIDFPGSLQPGDATLHLRFNGILNDKLRGFYRSTFVDDSGTPRVIATTQMESTDARRAFPCWDEPAHKATFEVTLVVDAGMSAYSNGPEVDRTAEGDKVRIRFAPTMVMSTYLVAFIVGPLEATEPVDVDGVPLRVVHRPGKGHLAPFALEVGAHALRFFTQYFGIPYPSDKLDLVAIPDFAAGAMENLGCVTFRDSALLVDPSRAARTELERVADVVCHEIAHMWFGDLVTMKWWNGIWLNEAFATFMEVLAVDAFRPEWQRWVSFGVEREAAMAVDGLHATRPVEFPVGRPEEAEGMFDVLTYQKGGSVLRMLEQFIGPDVFRDGIRAYLAAHSYGNTETADLWDALEQASGRPVRAIMHTWIDQGGYPLVRVGDDGSLSQEPFSYQGAPGGAIGSDWQIPIRLRSLDGTGPEPAPVLLDGDGRASAGTATGSVVNAGGSGFYRVAYPATTVTHLVDSWDRLTPLERFNAVSDSWSAALSGQEPLDTVIRLARGMAAANDGDPSVWSVIIGAFGLFDRIIPDADRPVLSRAVRTLFGPLASELGWDPLPSDTERTPALRASVLRILGTIGSDAPVRAEALRRFEASGTETLHPDTESTILDIVATTGGDAEFDRFLDRYRTPANPQEETRYLFALAAFDQPALADRTFELAMGEVRSQNAPYLLQAMMTQRVTGPATWGRITEAWDGLVDRFPSGTMPRMLAGARVLCSPPELAAEVVRFIESHPLQGAGRTVDQTLERLGVNVAFGQRHGAGLAELLEAGLAPLAE